jgi:hypothetical protein
LGERLNGHWVDLAAGLVTDHNKSKVICSLNDYAKLHVVSNKCSIYPTVNVDNTKV